MSETLGENSYDNDLAKKQAMGYQIVEDDVPGERIAEFGDPQYMYIEKTDNPKTYTVLSLPSAAPTSAEEPPELNNPDMTREATKDRIQNILGPDMLAGQPESGEQRKSA